MHKVCKIVLYFLLLDVDLLDLSQRGHSGTSKSGLIRLHASISSEIETMHKIDSRNSTKCIHIETYLQSFL